MILQKLIAVVFALFLVCFVAIVVEELFLGGKRRRNLERQRRVGIGAKSPEGGRERGGS